jgi:3-oxoacyl-(acyl-carrier-protein) synthase III
MSVGIVGVGGYVPDRIVANNLLETQLSLPDGWIEQRTGIRQRRAAAADEAASDVAAAAARRALDDAGLDASQLDLIVLGTSTPDELGPATACRVQALLGAENAVALDVVAACAGWLYGVRMAQGQFAVDPTMQYALVIGVEVYSPFLDPADRATAAIFGDGAGATVIGRVDGPHGIDHIQLGSDGRLADYVLIPAGGSRRPASQLTLDERGHTVQMKGGAIRNFIAARLGGLITDSLRDAGLGLDELTMVVPHQPNPKLVQSLAREAGVRDDQLLLTSVDVGNIGAASIPYSLSCAVAAGRLKPGDTVALATIGAGMTWGRGLLAWAPRPHEPRTPELVPPMIVSQRTGSTPVAVGGAS